MWGLADMVAKSKKELSTQPWVASIFTPKSVCEKVQYLVAEYRNEAQNVKFFSSVSLGQSR